MSNTEVRQEDEKIYNPKSDMHFWIEYKTKLKSIRWAQKFTRL